VKLHLQTILCAALAAVILLCGCKTTTVGKVRPDGSTVHELQYDPGPGLLSFQKRKQPPFAPGEIVAVLQKAKIPPGDEILINMHRFYDQILIADMTRSLSNAGYRVVFSTDQTAFSQGGFLRPFDKPATTAPPRREAELYLK